MVTHRWRFMAGIGLVTVIAFGATGCSSASQSPSPQATSAASAPPSAPASASAAATASAAALTGDLSVDVIDPVDLTVMTALAKEFQTANPGVTVKVNQVPEDTFSTKLQTSILAHDPPDVTQVYVPGAVSYFQPLDETVYAAHGLSPSDYNPGVLESTCTWEGKTYCAGGYTGAVVLAYSKDLFTAAGEPFPSATTPMTIDEYAALAKRLTKGEGHWGGQATPPTWWADTGLFLDQTGKTAMATDPTYVSTFGTLENMVKDGVAPSDAKAAQLGPVNGALDLFYAGQIAMVIFDPSNEGAMSPPISIGFAPVPIPAGTKTWVSNWTNGFGIPRYAKNPDAAAAFLALFATRGQELEMEQGLMPLRTKDAATFAAKGDLQAQMAAVAALARPYVFTPDLWSWAGTIEDAWATVQRGDADTSKALADAQPKAQQGLDTSWEKFDKDIKAN